MGNLANAFVDDAAVTAREAEYPAFAVDGDPIFDTGVNSGASCAPGIGIATDNPNLQESLFPATDGSGDLNTGSWTDLDQFGNERAAQISQLIGGPGTVLRTGDQIYTWDKTAPSYSAGGAASSGGQIPSDEGTLPGNVVRLWANPDNIGQPGNSVPDNNAPPVPTGNATLSTGTGGLATGWTSVP
jgi:hypothetical protein